MTLAVAWIVLPIVLSALSLGCGLLLETVSGIRLPGALLLPAGFIIISLATQFPHMADSTAWLQTPLVIVLALTGYGVARPWKRFQLDRWLAGSVGGVYAVFAAPVVLAGQATFLGYIRLDDTAFYQSMLDRAAAHSYNTVGLPPGTYGSALYEGYNFGYPLGSFLPLDTAHTLLRVDTLWLWQPYLAFLAALTALGLYQLTAGFLQSRALRACVAFFGSQAALYYGYALWGGVKELFVPIVILFAACLVPGLRTGGPRQVIPLAAASAAAIGGLSVGGGIWIVPTIVAGLTILIVSVVRAAEGVTQRTAAAPGAQPDLVGRIVGFFVTYLRAWTTAGVYSVAALGLAIPILSVSAHRLNHISKFTSGGKNGIGNLPHPLSWWQLPGIWPGGYFGYAPANITLTHLLGALVVLGAIFAVVMAWRRGRWEIVVAFATAIFACLVYVERATPWVGGKALAASSPLVLGIGLAGVAVVIESRRQVEGGIAIALFAVIAGAVLWSNALQYHAALLAPSPRLMELEKIGAKFSGQGPGLLTEYEPYAARHFLRGMAALEPSELGPPQQYAYLSNGKPAPQGVSPDVDELDLKHLLYFRTLIVRRTGSESRPPSAYSLAWSGRYYDVWQRPPGDSGIIKHLSLGSRFQPAAVPDCQDVMKLAQQASAAHGVLKTVYRSPVTVIEPDGRIAVPKQFGLHGEAYGLEYRTIPYRLELFFKVKSAGNYTVWVGGSFSSTLTAKIDGQSVGQEKNQTEWPGNFLDFGSVHLTRGSHKLGIAHSGPDWSPGSAARQPFGLGPFVIAQGTDQQKVSRIQPSKARSLCGKSLDWIEAVRG